MNIGENLSFLIKRELTGFFDDHSFLAPTVIELERPDDLKHGDISTNTALKYAKIHKMDAYILAKDISVYLSKKQLRYVDKIEAVRPGFINLYFSKEFFRESIREVLKMRDNFGKGNLLKGKTILLEHSSPNLFKPFHIGHLVNNVIGESIGRLLKNAGAEVLTMTFPSDVSLGIAKAVWGVMDKGWEADLDLNKIGEAYAWGTKKYEEDESAQKTIQEINLNLYNKVEDTKEWKVYIKGKILSYEHFVEITKKLGSVFNEVVYESETEVVGKEIVLRNTPGIFEKSDGAVIFRGSNYGLHDDVFINSAGFGTYLAKDVGLISIKFNKIKSKFNFDTSITITDVEQKSHFELVKIAVSQFEKEWADKSVFLQHGRLRLTEGRISSRMGNVPLVEDLMSALKEEVMPRVKDIENADRKAEDIAIGALKFPILRTGRGQNIIFDLKSALSTEGDSGVYLQYAYVRAKSVTAEGQRILGDYDKSKDLESDESETVIEKLLYRFPEVVERSCEEYSPNYLTTYLTEIAGSFNSFYAQNKIINPDDIKRSYYRLMLAKATEIVLKNGLDILGIPAPEKM